jgi:hypothetical protein
MNETKLIANRYQIGELVGQGGMGAVYRGTDTRTNHAVAIKQLTQEIIATGGEDAIERFRREVEALRRLDHPNIIKLLATARTGEKYYIVMEYAEGGSLADLIAREKTLSVERVLQIALDLVDALTRAHRLNIIHRDLKPDNVLLTADGTPRLTDFGVARIGDRTRLTQSGFIVGTGAYLSPEACRGQELDTRADIWSFGVLLFEMLTGRLPFTGNNPAAVITAILMTPAPDVRQFRADVPPALAALISGLLTKDPNQRISSIRQVGVYIEAILNGSEANAMMLSGDMAISPDALEELAERWDAAARQAQAAGAPLRMTDPNKAYYRGVASTWEAAARELRAGLGTAQQDNEPQTAIQENPHLFVPVSRALVEKVLERAGLRYSNLYEDKKEHVFSVIFSTMPTMLMNDRIFRLTRACESVIVLENGRLPNTQEPFIDFGFTAPPKLS